MGDIFDAFAESDKFDRQFKLASDRQNDAAAGRPVKFGENQSRASGGITESARLAERVLAGGGIENQKDFVRRVFDFFTDGATDLVQFLHQVGLGLQSACCIDDGDVGSDFDCLVDGFECNAGRIGALFSGDDLATDTLGPDRQLLDRGGTVKLQAIEAPQNEWESPLAVFEAAYNHECEVTRRINALVDTVMEVRDHQANAFLQWFVSEQVEEEAKLSSVFTCDMEHLDNALSNEWIQLQLLQSENRR